MAAVRRETFVARTIRLWYVHKVMCSVLRGLFLITSLAAYALTSANSQEIRGVVRDVTGFSLNNILVEASVFDSGSFTQLVTTTDLAGRYSFPFSRGDWSIEPGNPYVSKYRLLIYDGKPGAKWIDAQWKVYSDSN